MPGINPTKSVKDLNLIKTVGKEHTTIPTKSQSTTVEITFATLKFLYNAIVNTNQHAPANIRGITRNLVAIAKKTIVTAEK